MEKSILIGIIALFIISHKSDCDLYLFVCQCVCVYLFVCMRVCFCVMCVAVCICICACVFVFLCVCTGDPRYLRGLHSQNITQIPKPRITRDNCFGILLSILPLKRTKSTDTQGKNPQMMNFYTINKPCIVKTANNKPADNKLPVFVCVFVLVCVIVCVFAW